MNACHPSSFGRCPRDVPVFRYPPTGLQGQTKRGQWPAVRARAASSRAVLSPCDRPTVRASGDATTTHPTSDPVGGTLSVRPVALFPALSVWPCTHPDGIRCYRPQGRPPPTPGRVTMLSSVVPHPPLSRFSHTAGQKFVKIFDPCGPKFVRGFLSGSITRPDTSVCGVLPVRVLVR